MRGTEEMTVLNRRALVALCSEKECLDVREALAAAGIPSDARIRGMARAMERARVAGGLRAGGTYTIYVRREDYGRAACLLRSFRRGG